MINLLFIDAEKHKSKRVEGCLVGHWLIGEEWLVNASVIFPPSNETILLPFLEAKRHLEGFSLRAF